VEDIDLPSPELLARLLRWLTELRVVYMKLSFCTAPDELPRSLLAQLILDKIETAVRNVKKTEAAVKQYNLISARMERYLDKTEFKGRTQRYSSAWNQIQVYAGVREMYTQFMWNCSESMVDTCATLNSLNGQYISQYSNSKHHSSIG
jgi:hypothetical protein